MVMMAAEVCLLMPSPVPVLYFLPSNVVSMMYFLHPKERQIFGNEGSSYLDKFLDLCRYGCIKSRFSIRYIHI